MAGLMDGKKGVVLGVTNKRSIAWGITQVLRAEGAEVALTYQESGWKRASARSPPSWTSRWCCRATSRRTRRSTPCSPRSGERFGKLDFLVHSIAFAPKEALEGKFVDTSREAFRIALDVSAYSLVALAAVPGR